MSTAERNVHQGAGATVGSAPEEYAGRLSERKTVVAALTRRHVWLGNAKLAALALGVVCLWAVFGAHLAGMPLLVAPAGLLAVLAVWHDRLLRRLDRATRAAAFYEQALTRLGDSWPGTGDPGDRFQNPDHPYAADLDLFGRGSLFELLATTRTRSGQDALAGWLLQAADPEEIRERHDAIRELGPRVDLRESLALAGTTIGAGVEPDRLRAWGAEPPIVRGRALAVVAAILGGAALVSLVGYAAGWWSAGPFYAAIALDALYWWRVRDRVRQILRHVDRSAHDLALLASLLHVVEGERLASARLLHVQRVLGHAGAAARIRHLQRLSDLLNSRSNQLFAPLAALVLWTPQVAFAIERWRQASGASLGGWLDAIGEFEAISALGEYAYGRPLDAFPEIVPGVAVFEGEDVSHPLVPRTRAVGNDVAIGGAHPHMLLVSGSNMSGKSTLLRTVGVNTVLALAGAPVRARRLRVSPLAVGATLRVQDSLAAGQSRFFAEISRLRAIVSLTGGTLPVLFLLDELLSGTNSHDREHGAAAIVRGLMDRGAIGLVTTHDLALAAIADTLAPRAANVHFEDQFENGALTFDYRMRQGVVHSSNALELMRAVGLDV